LFSIKIRAIKGGTLKLFRFYASRTTGARQPIRICREPP
jgi:hypothetical protein